MADPTVYRRTRSLKTQESPFVEPEENENWGKSLASPEHDDSEPETATDRLSIMLESVTGEGRAELKVYRLSQGQLEYCKGYTPQAFENGSFDMLREEFGAGEYELRLYAVQPGSNRFCVRNKIRIKIADLKVNPYLQPRPDSGINQALEMLAQSNANILKALTEKPVTPPIDPMAQMTQMFSMMGLMREAMGLTAQTQQKSSIAEMVDAIKELRGAAELVSPPAEDNDSPMKMFGQVADLIKLTAGQPKAVEPGPAVAFHTNPAPALPPAQDSGAYPQNPPQSPLTTADNQGEDMNVLGMVKLRGYLNQLVTYAATAQDPQKGADLIVEKLPDEMIDILEMDDWFSMLIQFEAKAQPYQAWLTRARDLALAELLAEDDESGFETPPVDGAAPAATMP